MKVQVDAGSVALRTLKPFWRPRQSQRSADCRRRSRARQRSQPSPCASALPPLPPPPHPHAAAAAAAAATLLASVVPTFPRIGGQPVRDWIGKAVDNLPGFNGDDLARLLFPDLVGLVDGPSALIGGLLLIAFVYWEGGILLRQLRERQRKKRQQGQGGGGEGSGDGSSHAEADAQLKPGPVRREELVGLDRARYERRRGLGYLALLTAFCIWMLGVVNGPTPFQP